MQVRPEPRAGPATVSRRRLRGAAGTAVDKGDEAFRAGEYDPAAELFRSTRAGLA